jgi:hypothetical protein
LLAAQPTITPMMVMTTMISISEKPLARLRGKAKFMDFMAAPAEKSMQ